MRNIRAQRAVRIDHWCTKFRPTQTEMSSGWQPWYSLETLKTSFSVCSECQGCHPDDLSVLRDSYLQHPLKHWTNSCWMTFYQYVSHPTLLRYQIGHLYIYISGSIYIYGGLGAEQGTSRCMDQWWLAKWCINIRDRTWRYYVYADNTHWCILCGYINSLRPRQNGRLFADDTFKSISSIENSFFRLKFH